MRVHLSAETSRVNPFDFIPDFGANRLPMDYAQTEVLSLAPYRDQGAPDPAVRSLMG